MHHHTHRRPVLRAVAVAAALVAAVPAWAINVSWVGPNASFWDLAANWNPGLPGAADDVLLGAFDTTFRQGNVGVLSITGSGQLRITGGSLSPAAASSVGSLLLSGGTLAGAGSLSVSGAGGWTGGTMSGTGTSSFSNTLAISGNSIRALNGGRVLNNAGTVTWTNAAGGNEGLIQTGAGAAFNNSGTWLDQNALNNRISNDFGGAQSNFNNSGTYTKSGASTTQMNIGFNNSGAGAVNVNSGILQLDAGGSSSGAFNVAAGATVQFSGGSFTLSSITGAGAGQLLVSGGTTTVLGGNTFAGQLNINAGTLNIGGTFSAGAYNHSGGTVSGAGSLSVSGAGGWTGGTMSGTGTSSFSNTLAISGNSIRALNGGRVLNNSGTVTWTNAAGGNEGLIQTGAGAAFNNSGTWLDQNALNNRISNDFGGAQSNFNNSGTYTKSGASTTQMNIGFNNSGAGAVNVNSGILQLDAGGSSSGAFNVAAGATVQFSGGSFTLSSITGAGAGQLLVSGGTTTVLGGNTFAGQLNINAGTLNIGGTFSAGAYNHSGGTVSGAGSLSVSGAGGWTGGTMSGTGTSSFSNTLAISGNSIRALNGGRVLNNAGTVTWTNAAGGNEGLIQTGAGAAFNNSGTWLDQNALNNRISNDFGGAQSNFNNSGTYTKSGASTTQMNIGFNNSGAGAVNVNSGILQLDAGGSSSGAFNVAAGATVQFSGGSFTLSSITGAGAGQLLVSGGTTTVLGGNTFAGQLNINAGTLNIGGTFSAGAYNHSGGTVSGAGSLSVSGAGGWTGGTMSGSGTSSFSNTLAISGNSIRALNGGRVLNNSGTVTWTNAAGGNEGLIQTGAGAAFNNFGTWLDQNPLDNQISNDFGGAQSNFNNSGTYTKSGASTTQMNIGFNNSGQVQVSAGTLALNTGHTGPAGTLRIGAGGAVTLGAASTVGSLLHSGSGASSLAIGGNALTVSTDYNNANFGTGDAFNRRANVQGTGQMLASGNANQGISSGGGLVTVVGGASTTPTLSIGHVRVGSSTLHYNVDNLGSAGPALRGAVQTGVNGASISDPRLAISAGNWGPVATSASSLQDIVYTTNTAGVMPALSNQRVNVVNNFENTRSQLVTIVLAPGAAAFNPAAGNATPNPVTVPNQRVGGSALASLTINNTAIAGAFSEDLNASFGVNVGAATNNAGTVTGLLAGANNASAMRVGVNTASAGAKSGSVGLNYQTTGTVNGVSNGLGVTALNPAQTINVNGNVYQVAQPSPSTLPGTINLGNFRAGAPAQAAPGIVITNSNIAPAGFQEGLAAAILSTTGQATGVGFANAVAGSNGTLNVGLSGINAGANSGSVNVQLRSNGIATTGDTGLGSLDLGAAQTVTVNATGFRLAQPNAIAPINFGNVLAGSTQTRTLTVSNGATADGFSEALNAAFGAVGGTNAASFSGAGAINGLVAGGSDNTTMVVTLNTSATGTKTANIQVLLNSNGTAIGNGLGLTALPTQVINLDGVITGVVGNLASAGLNPTTVNFGKFREGAPNQTQQLTVSNLTVGPGEGLNASFGASSGGASNNAGSITSLATGGVNNTSMSVTLSGLASAGPKSGTQALNFVSDGTFNAGVVTPLPAQSVSLSAEVYRLASAGAGNTGTVIVDARRVGDAAVPVSITVARNLAANDGFSEGMRGSIGAAPAGFVVSGPSSTALIPAGGSESRTVSLPTATAGNFSGDLVIGLVSNGAGTSGFGDLPLADRVLTLSGKVYTPAVGQSATATVDFGVVRVGDIVSARNITVNNTAAVTALNDTLTANLSGTAAPFSGGNASGIAAQGSGQIGVGLGTSAAGVFNVNANLSFLSHNPDMADAPAGANAGVNLLATINNLANADFDLLSGLGVLSQNGSDYVLDLGTINLGSSVLSRLHLDNDVLGPADDLRGNFDLSAADDFSYLGWDTPVGPLAAGQATGELEIDYMASTLGPFQDSIVFNGRGTNASDPAGLAQTRRLIIRANVIDPNGNPVPEPGSLALMLAAAVAGLIARRRRSP